MNIDPDEGNDADPFGQKLFSFQQDGDVYEAVVVGRSGQYLGILLVTGKTSLGKGQEISKTIFLETPSPK